jgi:hypothetical protein
MEFFTINLPNGGEWTAYFDWLSLRDFLSLKQLCRNGLVQDRPLRSDAAVAPLDHP